MWENYRQKIIATYVFLSVTNATNKYPHFSRALYQICYLKSTNKILKYTSPNYVSEAQSFEKRLIKSPRSSILDLIKYNNNAYRTTQARQIPNSSSCSKSANGQGFWCFSSIICTQFDKVNFIVFQLNCLTKHLIFVTQAHWFLYSQMATL